MLRKLATPAAPAYRRQVVLSVLAKNASQATSSVDSGEISHFNEMSKHWWAELGVVKPLHSMNELRIPFIRDGLINTGAARKEHIESPEPLKNLSILDIGCGGGILSESLARLGSNVTGLDAAKDVIEVAKHHALLDPSLKTLNYVCTSVEDHATTHLEKYDAVVASEVLEHVTEREVFVNTCVKCLKPGGSIFITTINKTMISWLAGIVLAENVVNLVPKGTHQWEKFISPFHTQRLLEDNNCRTRIVHGMVYNFFTNTWCWSPNDSINYAIHAVKDTD